ncbi:glutathione S-transferase [Lecanosticta acicola]|uniref:Glutathione S-transferase n=1 Tax=Lecanosticta acicola TaxID=111012 RepID=A0AAI8YXL0_9PEZI|nr:glutathione S-transferase [Lecanosticta acicola]
MLVLHHLGISQSERITWLLEELGLEYKLVKHTRAPLAAPDSLQSLPGNATGKAPFIEDTTAGITLAESNAITDYIIWKHGGGRLALAPDHKNFADYLYWKDFANSSLQATLTTSMFVELSDTSPEHMVRQFAEQRLQAALKHMDDRLRENQWLAGEEFTAAETMSVYSLTTQRYFGPRVSLKPYGNLLRWIKDCSERPAYKRAMEKGDPEMKLLLEAEPPEKTLMDSGGVESGAWKK